MKVLAVILLFVWGILLMMINLEYGGPLPEVAHQYLEQSSSMGAVNVVTVILADYRLYDTIGEATVLFAAILGVTLILGRNHHRTEQKIDQLDQLYGGRP